MLEWHRGDDGREQRAIVAVTGADRAAVVQAQQVIIQAASDPVWRWAIVGVVVPLVAVLATWWRR